MKGVLADQRRRRFVAWGVFIGLLSVLGICLAAETNEPAESSKPKNPSRQGFSADYPGMSSDGSVRDVALWGVQAGVQAYYRVYGRWPANWQEVRGAGLFDVDLVGFEMQTIFPDAGRFDFASDLYYDSNPNSDGKAQIYQLAIRGGTGAQARTRAIEFPSGTLGDSLRWIANERGDNGPLQYAEDEGWLKRLALSAILEMSVYQYRSIKGAFPTPQEFLDSGLGPIGSNSINPYTGKPYRLDGSPFDFNMVIEEDRVDIYAVEGNGGRNPYLPD